MARPGRAVIHARSRSMHPAAQGGGPSRVVAGVAVESLCSEVSAVVVRQRGPLFGGQAEIIASRSMRLPQSVTDRYRRILGNRARLPGEPGVLATELASHQAAQIDELRQAETEAMADLLAVGVTDPGLWDVGGANATGYLSLCDAASLAEQTGISVIDGFPAGDLAGGGQGGPLSALPHWLLLADASRTRLLVDIGRTTRATFLPARQSTPPSLHAFDVGPGTLLLDRLAEQLTGGEMSFDAGGRLAVQGRRIPDLIDHWMSEPYFRRPPPRWHPLGVRPEAELHQTVQMAVDAGWTIRDLLCTTSLFIADTVQQAVEQWLSDSPAIDEIIVAGGGQQNGLLLREIQARFPQQEVHRAEQLGWSDGGIEAATAAMLALLHVSQVPASVPCATGSSAPRVLGRLTPGDATQWNRLLQQLQAAGEGEQFRAAG